MRLGIYLSPKSYRIFAILAISARTKNDLVKLSGLKRATVGHCVAHLIRLELIKQTGMFYYITDHGIDCLNYHEEQVYNNSTTSSHRSHREPL